MRNFAFAGGVRSPAKGCFAAFRQPPGFFFTRIGFQTATADSPDRFPPEVSEKAARLACDTRAVEFERPATNSGFASRGRFLPDLADLLKLRHE